MKYEIKMNDHVFVIANVDGETHIVECVVRGIRLDSNNNYAYFLESPYFGQWYNEVEVCTKAEECAKLLLEKIIKLRG